MTASDPAASENPYRAPDDRLSEELPPGFRRVLTVPGVFFFTAGLIAQMLSLWFAVEAAGYVRRAMSTDYYYAVHYVVLAASLMVVGLIFGALAVGVCTFRSNSSRPRSMTVVARIGRGAAVVLMAVVGCFAAFLTYAGAGAGISAAVSGGSLLLVGCATWVTAILYESRRDDQATFRVVRWLIRTVAMAIGLWTMASAVRSILMGDIVSGIPQLLFGVLLLRQSFGGLMLAGNPIDR